MLQCIGAQVNLSPSMQASVLRSQEPANSSESWLESFELQAESPLDKQIKSSLLADAFNLLAYDDWILRPSRAHALEHVSCASS